VKPPAVIAVTAALGLSALWFALGGSRAAMIGGRLSATDESALRPPLPLPADDQLAKDLADAIELRKREDFDRMHDAWDPGELFEHATYTQTALDHRMLGNDALFVFGDELFDYEFRRENGMGNGLRGRDRTLAGVLPAPNMRRVHKGRFGGPDSHNCAGCHFKGGPDGAGTNTQNAFLHGDGTSSKSADQRNPPHMLGLGPVQALAREMSRELAAQVAAGTERARADGASVALTLTSKGVDFGVVRISSDGAVDDSGLSGVDPDLIVKPFGWKGHRATIRDMAEESFRIHIGIVSMRLQRQAQAGILDSKVYGDGPWYDIDQDGVSMELDDGMLSTIAAYLAQLEIPVMRPPGDPGMLDRFARGSQLFDEAGCAGCHRRTLELMDPIIEIRPQQPEYADREPIRIDVAMDGDHPKIEPKGPMRNAYLVALFGDLKRHDMGPHLATQNDEFGIPASVFLTRPLWGLCDTGPYLHDGRAPTVHDAIRLHGGEASAARAAYLALSEVDRGSLRVFLMSLGRQPKLFVH
jgi:mono/diheme cytochrome c family protein